MSDHRRPRDDPENAMEWIHEPYRYWGSAEDDDE